MTPSLVMHNGRYLQRAMLEKAVSKFETDSTTGNAGRLSPTRANWPIVETAGMLSVVSRREAECAVDTASDDVAVTNVKASYE